MQRKMALLELSNEADFFGFVTKNYIIPGIRTGEHSITFPIDDAYSHKEYAYKHYCDA